jgi:integrase
MRRIKLTDRYLKSLQNKKPEQRRDHADAFLPGFGVHQSEGGALAFYVGARWPTHPDSWTQRRVGKYPAMSLEQAREKAKGWLAMLDKGIDPRVQDIKERAAAQRAAVNSFAYIAGEFLDRYAAKLVHAGKIRTMVEREFVRRWGARSASDIEPAEVAAAIRQIAKRSEAQAHISLSHLRRMYNWAIASGEFGLDRSPVERLKPADLIGRKVSRERVLQNEELRAVWEAACTEGYPAGCIVQMLILTGQRLNEIAGLSWREIDLDDALISIPAERMKQSRAHEVPLSDMAMEIMRSLPRFARGEYAFTTTSGEKPFVGFGRVKERLDKRSGVQGWVLHDLRRTARTHWSALPVPDMVKELAMAHARPGLHAVYDQFAYRNEKRELMRLWELRLQRVLHPVVAGVVDLSKARSAVG